MVDSGGKLNLREHQGCSFELCPPASQTNFHNAFKYPLQLVISRFCQRSVNQRF